jgi:hypothetical protein
MLTLGFTAPADTDGDGLMDEHGAKGRRVTLTTDPTQWGNGLQARTTTSGR